MKQGKFTLRKLSQIWGDNHQSLNAQLPELSEGSYTPTYPTQSEYREGGATLNTAIDDASETWTNVQSINSDTGENELSRTSSEQIPINVWGDLLLNGRKVISEHQQADTPYFNSLLLNEPSGFNKTGLRMGEFAFADDGSGDIFLNLGGSPAQIVRFLRSDSHLTYDNIEDIVVREINYITSVEPSSDPNLYVGCLWYDDTNNLLYKWDGNDFVKIYYPTPDDNDSPSTEGTGRPTYDVIYVYAPFDSNNVKVPTDILYWNGTKLVSFGGNGGNGRIYVKCSTAAATAIKDITITSAATSYADLVGTELAIEFTNGSDVDVYSTHQLDVNGLGAINFKNYTALSTNAKINNLPSNSIIDVIILESSTPGTYIAAVQSGIEVTSPANETYHFMLFPRNFNTAQRNRVANTYAANADNSLSYTNNVITGKNTQAVIKNISLQEGYGSGGTTIGTNIQTEGTILADDKISTKNSIAIDVTDSNTEIKSSQYMNVTTVEVGNHVDVRKGNVKFVDIYFEYNPDTDGINKKIFTVPAGYMMCALNASDFNLGGAWYNSDEAGTGPITTIEYQGLSAVSISWTPQTSTHNNYRAFGSGDVPLGPTDITITSGDLGKGSVVVYGQFVLIPDSAA